MGGMGTIATVGRQHRQRGGPSGLAGCLTSRCLPAALRGCYSAQAMQALPYSASNGAGAKPLQVLAPWVKLALKVLLALRL